MPGKRKIYLNLQFSKSDHYIIRGSLISLSGKMILELTLFWFREPLSKLSCTTYILSIQISRYCSTPNSTSLIIEILHEKEAMKFGKRRLMGKRIIKWSLRNKPRHWKLTFPLNFRNFSNSYVIITRYEFVLSNSTRILPQLLSSLPLYPCFHFRLNHIIYIVDPTLQLDELIKVSVEKVIRLLANSFCQIQETQELAMRYNGIFAL